MSAPELPGFPGLAKVCLLAVGLLASCMGYGPRTIERYRRSVQAGTTTGCVRMYKATEKRETN
jgi:hypothetical protein